MMIPGEPTPTIAELISFLRACHDQIGTEGYSRPRFRAVLAILEAEAKPMVNLTLPDCMMPDGADPCRGYHELRAKVELARLDRQ